MAEVFKFEFQDGAKVILSTEVVNGVTDCLVLTNQFTHHNKPVSIKTPLIDTDTKEDFSGKLAGAILRSKKELVKNAGDK